MEPEEIRLTLRLPQELHARLQWLAQDQERSLNGQIVYLLKTAVEDAVQEQPVPRPTRQGAPHGGRSRPAPLAARPGPARGAKVAT